MLKPDLGRKIKTKQRNQKVAHDTHSKDREFELNDKVLVQNLRGEPKWVEAIFVERTGPVSYKVRIDEEIAERHVDQMLRRKDTGKSKRYKEEHNEDYMISLGSQQVSTETTHTNDGPPCCTPSTNNVNADQPRYPTRVRQPPSRLTYKK